ncbi:hypothetical protein [Puia dinghuensis]|nr:hypothetical protein [Puia dinghuensis]
MAWSIFDDSGHSDQTLESDDIDRVKKYFGALLEDTKILTGLQIIALPPNKRPKALHAQEFLISKLFSKWVIFDGNTQTDRWLDAIEIAWIKKLIPDLINATGYNLDLLATPVQANKLLQLSLEEKASEPGKTINKPT